MSRLTLVLIIFFTSITARAAVVEGLVVDSSDGSPLVSCAVAFVPGGVAVQTDIDGRFRVSLSSGLYTVKSSYVGFEPYTSQLRVGIADTSLTIAMRPVSSQLREITITAKESTGPTTASRIDRDAMAHLQPSSFTDLLELIPGNISQNPDMGSVNSIKLRETGNVGATGTVSDNADYAMTSLGTAFNVDGAPIVTDANHQSVGIEDAVGRNAVNRGVDMRTISTDNIESVEIVRGIPSAEYGNLTSGLVNIRRSRKSTPWTARFKADGYSKLLYVGKGISAGPERRNTINADLGWLDSKVDPRNNLENYRRLNASVRSFLQWTNPTMLTEWNLAADYSTTVDKAKSDPDLALIKIDEYSANNQKATLTSALTLSPRKLSWLQHIKVNTSLSYGIENLTRRRQVAPSRPVVAPVSSSEGVHDGYFILDEYIADYRSEGRPFSAYAKLGFDGAIPSWGGSTLSYKAGADWTLSKDYGRGQIYDPSRPLSAQWTSRPRPYSDIPAMNVVSVYAEESLDTSVGFGRLNVQAGVHGIALAGLDRRYALAGKMYFDPRLNAVWTFPSFSAGRRAVTLSLAGGYGVGTRMPTADYLYPQPAFLDILQLSYYNPENPKELSRVSLRTYINDATNYDLKPARNHKWELRLGAEVGANRLSVTYFEERLNSGFRYSNVYDAYAYTKYDPSGIDGSNLTSAPDLSHLPSSEQTVLRGYRRAENGSRIDKRGVEFQLTTARWKALATSLTVTGAWFHTRYSNSMRFFDPVSDVVGNTAVSDLFVGLYNTNDGRVNNQFNTNFMFDTQIPKLGLVFSTTLQCMWFVKTRRLEQNGVPESYISAIDGLIHDFKDSDADDPMLKYLIQYYNPQLYDTYTVPTALYVNLKATKSIGKWLRVALFVNRIIDYLPAYKSNGLTVRRTSDAYFGMELNFTI